MRIYNPCPHRITDKEILNLKFQKSILKHIPLTIRIHTDCKYSDGSQKTQEPSSANL